MDDSCIRCQTDCPAIVKKFWGKFTFVATTNYGELQDCIEICNKCTLLEGDKVTDNKLLKNAQDKIRLYYERLNEEENNREEIKYTDESGNPTPMTVWDNLRPVSPDEWDGIHESELEK